MVAQPPPTVTVIHPDGTTDTIPVGDFPLALEYSPATDNIYVANFDSVTVTVIHPDGTTDTIPVGDGPFALEYSPATNNIYVANFDSDTVSIIPP
jgi:YVTN family beta-propeller protein